MTTVTDVSALPVGNMSRVQGGDANYYIIVSY